MKEESIWIGDHAAQKIRERVMMNKPLVYDLFLTYPAAVNEYGQNDCKRYEQHIASRRTYPYPVKEEQDGKEIPESEFRIEKKLIAVEKEYPNGTKYFSSELVEVAIPIEPETFDVKDGIIQGLEEGAEAWKAEYDNCRTILQELVRCNPIWKRNLLQADVTIAEFTTALEQAKEFLKTYQHGYE